MIHINDWRQMSGMEKEAVIFSILDVPQEQLQQIIHEYIRENGKKPNAIFISWITLAKMPVKLKTLEGLRVIPMDAQEGQFVLSLQDPHNWGDLFYQ